LGSVDEEEEEEEGKGQNWPEEGDWEERERERERGSGRRWRRARRDLKKLTCLARLMKGQNAGTDKKKRMRKKKRQIESNEKVFLIDVHLSSLLSLSLSL
jgi:Mg-chelatase subunit ChlD